MTAPPPKTIVITGVSSHSPLSTHVATHLISQYTSTNQPTSIALLGPSLTHLQQTASTLLSSIPTTSSSPPTIIVFEVNITSAQSIGVTAHSIRAQLGAADIVIHNAPAHLPYPSVTVPGTLTPIRGADEDDWWDVFEVNVRSIQSVARHFFTKMREGAVFVNVLPGVGGSTVNGDVGLAKGMAAWDASGVAAERVVRYLAEENGRFGCFGVYVRQDGALSEEEQKESIAKVVGLLGS